MSLSDYSSILTELFPDLEYIVTNRDELSIHISNILKLFKDYIYFGEGAINNNKLIIVNIAGVEVTISPVIDINESYTTLFIAVVNEKQIAKVNLVYGKEVELKSFAEQVNNYLYDHDMNIQDRLLNLNVYLPEKVYDVDAIMSIIVQIISTHNRINTIGS